MQMQMTQMKNKNNDLRANFLHSAFITQHSNLYCTGDLARWLPADPPAGGASGGVIEFLGRIDHQVKIRGFRIELEEIENCLLKHKEIKEVIVIAVESAGGPTSLCAYFVASSQLPIDMIREYLAAQLPVYMLPSYFVQLEKMPHLPTGKIDRKGLPQVAPQGETGTFVPPSTPGEKALTEIWEDVLNAEKIGINDNFFRLGGDSIRSIQVVSKAHAIGMHFTSRELFLYPSIRTLLQNLNRNQSPEAGDSKENFQRISFNLISSQDRAKITGEIEDAYPLTMLQAGLVFHSELSSGTALYHDIASYRLQGRFLRQAFEDALKYVIKRHNILRTTYDLHNFSQYLQLVHREIPLPLHIENLEGIPRKKQEEILNAFMETEKSRRFDWSQPGLIRFIIHILENEVFQYTLSIHDSTLDGWSMSSLNTELFLAYFAFAKGQEPPAAPPLKAFYRDYVQMELETLKQEEQKKYWQELLTDSTFTKLARWPRENPHYDAIEVCFHKVDISLQVSDALNKLARSLSVPLKCILLAAHMRVISVFSGNTDVLTGIEHNGRPEIPDGEKILGLFLNTLPFRLKLTGGTWVDLFKAVYNAEMELLPYRNYPMARIRQEGYANNQPLFETVFNYTNFYVMKNLQEIDNLDVVNVNGVLETDFPFRSEFRKGVFTDEIELDIHYNKYIFCKEHIQAVSRYYTRLLQAISNNSMERYESFPVLNEIEQKEFLEKMNNTRTKYPGEKCFHNLFEAQATRTPAKVAVLDNDKQWTYKELNDRANHLAKELVKRGAGPGTIVAAALERSFQLLNAIIGIFKARAVYLPLEINSPAERISYVLDQSQCFLILIEQENLPHLTDMTFNQEAGRGREIITLELLSKNGEGSSNLSLESSPQDLAYVIYTSGSTGIPKGVMIEHQGMLNHLYSKIYGLHITGSDIIAQNASHCFDISIWQFLASLPVGGVTAIYANKIIMEPALFMNQLVKNCVTIFELVPSYLSIILEIPGINAPDFRVLRWLIVTGEELKLEPVTRWFERFPGIKMVNAYGPTEASDDITHFIIDKAPEIDRIPIGKPLANLNIYIVDSCMQLSPICVKGEICVSGVGVGRGYLYDDKRTREAFIEDPFAPGKGQRLYKTGDIGCWLPDGNILFFGRKDHQVKIRGFRIELGEIERRLAEHPQVKEAIVLDKEDEKGNKFLYAYMVLGEVDLNKDNTQDFDLVKLKAFLLKRLPDYMIPSHFVIMKNFPLTPNGKVDRKALPDPGGNSNTGGKYIPPANADEEKLVNIWSQVLGIQENQISVDHHFFDLGGNSIMLMALANLINKNYSAQLKIMDFFNLTTVRQLAQHLGKSTKKNEIEQFEL
ncbi:MAG: amino acid adenylation domain-containing protein [Acidobacteria bacterium]|nr:amino acid adenylation domain-containing protein [Acidobacteriota bacterium]